MTTRRLVALLLVVAGGLSISLVMPTTGNSEPVGINLYLPEYVGSWYGMDQQITKAERNILAEDTEFARKLYTNGAGDAIFASIVLSGHDLDNSIHRPERCLPAQGLTIADSRTLQIPLAGGRKLEVTRLNNVRQAETRDGRMIALYNLNYYWFVGYHHLTASHLERTVLDIEDRILKGYNQRWAYITVASEITQGQVRFGRSEKETDAMIQDFIVKLFPQIIGPNEEPSIARRSEKPVILGSL